MTPICPKALSGWICTKFGVGGPLVDVINCADFFVDQVRGIEFVGGGVELKVAVDTELPFGL